MASTFKCLLGHVTNTATSIYTVPASTQTVSFSATFCNIDDTNKADHYLTLKINRSGSYYFRFNALPIPYGSSFDTGKLVLETGDQIYINAEANSVLDYAVDYLEKV